MLPLKANKAIHSDLFSPAMVVGPTSGKAKPQQNSNSSKFSSSRNAKQSNINANIINNNDNKSAMGRSAATSTGSSNVFSRMFQRISRDIVEMHQLASEANAANKRRKIQRQKQIEELQQLRKEYEENLRARALLKEAGNPETVANYGKDLATIRRQRKNRKFRHGELKLTIRKLVPDTIPEESPSWMLARMLLSPRSNCSSAKSSTNQLKFVF